MILVRLYYRRKPLGLISPALQPLTRGRNRKRSWLRSVLYLPLFVGQIVYLNTRRRALHKLTNEDFDRGYLNIALPAPRFIR
jgi:hypothetical protein